MLNFTPAVPMTGLQPGTLMTILVVDAGNTRIKWAILAQGVLDNAGQTERPTHSADHFQTFAAQFGMQNTSVDQTVNVVNGWLAKNRAV